MYAASKGRDNCVSALIQHGGEETLNMQCKAGWNALMHAASNGHAGVVTRLRAAGAADVRTKIDVFYMSGITA